jgi:hypothetical protein
LRRVTNQHHPSPPPQQYGPPPQPYGPPAAWPPRPTRPGVNGFAIAALVLSIVGGILLSVIFAFVALGQVKRTGQKGRGLALASLAVSGVWVLVFAILIAVAVLSGADRDDGGRISGAGDVSATALRAGDCVNDLDESDSVLSLPAVPCAEPHEGEVFAVFDLEAGPYPGEDRVFTLAQERCSNEFETYAPSMVDDTKIELFLLQPSQLSWGRGDREITCIATDPSARRVGSIKG